MHESGQNAVLKITQSDLIDELSDDFIGIYDRETITDIIKGLEENVVYHLKRATKEKSVLIKLFFGLQINSRIVNEQEVNYPSKVSRPTLISQIEAKIGNGKGAAYDQKLKVVKLKSMAETLLFIQKHDFADFDALSDYADAASARTKELTAKIKAAENRMAEIAVLKTHIINYAKTRDVYAAYRKAGYARKYYDAHESDILIHKAAKKAFDELALKKLPTVKSLQAEYSDLLVQKKLDYAELSKARDEAKQLQIYKANAEMLLRTDAEEQRQTREHQQEK